MIDPLGIGKGVLVCLGLAAACIALGIQVVSAQGSPQEIPALSDIPAKVARTHPELVSTRADLLGDRAALHKSVEEQAARCGAVEEGSASYSACADERETLLGRIDGHVQASRNFNDAVHRAVSACVGDQGYQLRFALADCERTKPGLLSETCFRGTGLAEKSLRCIASYPATGGNPYAALAACGIAATTVIDAANNCQDAKSACVASALRTDREETAKCRD